MVNRRKQKDAERKERRTKRDEREQAAGKLLDKAPDLTSLSITIHETRREGSASDTHHIRRFILENTPAHFEVFCSDPTCEDGGYDVTQEILRALMSHQVKFEGEQHCGGRCGPIDCGRRLRYEAVATYREPRAQPSPGTPRRDWQSA
jgi:hypothetical protein